MDSNGAAAKAIEKRSDEGLPKRSDVFISYSHKDRVWKDWLLDERASSTISGTIDLWSDDEIQPSDDWKKQIETALMEAEVAVLLVSRHFLESSFIRKKELPAILKKRQQKSGRILWVPVDGAAKSELSKSGSDGTGLAELQATSSLEFPLEDIRARSPELLDAARQSILGHIEKALDPSGFNLRKVLHKKYDVVRRLAKGASRTLFLARDHTMKRWVSITTLRSNETLEEFERSLLDASMVDDIESFLTIHEARLDSNPAHCVRQYIDGETLSAQLEHGRMQYPFLRDVLIRIGRGLDMAHRRGFFHLNIKPSNIMIDKSDRAFLSPMSRTRNYYERLKNRQWKDLDKEDQAYAIPEFFGPVGSRGQYGKSDQYLLGMLGYHMITGKLPLRTSGSEVPASLRQFRELDPIAGLPECRSCPEVLASCIMRMLSLNPEDRFPTLQDAVDQMGQFRDESLAVAKDSYRRIAATPNWESVVFKSFYDDLQTYFTASKTSTKAVQRFRELDWNRQYEMLKEAVLLLLVFCEFDARDPREPTVLSRTKAKHNELAISDIDFDKFGDLLIDNLVCHDPECKGNPDMIERMVRAWRKSLEPGIRFMKLHANHG